jgi:hypothetical protein
VNLSTVFSLTSIYIINTAEPPTTSLGITTPFFGNPTNLCLGEEQPAGGDVHSLSH